MTLRIPRLALLAGLVLTGSLALTLACGGGDDDGDTASTTTQGSDGTGEGDTATPAGGDTGGDPTAPPSGLDACELLTREEVEEALGQEAADQQERSVSGAYQTCTWNTKEVALKFVIVQVHSGVSGDEFTAQQASAGAFLNEEVHPVDGLGDAAYEVAGSLYAHQGDYEIVLAPLLGFNFDDPDEAAQGLEVNRRLMESALSRLP